MSLIGGMSEEKIIAELTSILGCTIPGMAISTPNQHSLQSSNTEPGPLLGLPDAPDSLNQTGCGLAEVPLAEEPWNVLQPQGRPRNIQQDLAVVQDEKCYATMEDRSAYTHARGVQSNDEEAQAWAEVVFHTINGHLPTGEDSFVLSVAQPMAGNPASKGDFA